jgi:ATP-binding cassette subfamily C protein
LKKTGIQKKVSNWSIMDYFNFSLFVTQKNLSSSKKKGIDTFIVNYSYHFSGGERQRLALARVILRKPVLLLLDEATASLDQENEKKFLTYLSEIKKTSTVVFVTHKTELLKFFDN